ncbi:MAG: amino acid adenylation domain-containing protein [Pseudoalteromonas sp.]|uniref:non-ribosomal peptide synthetase n=1 Tax=Pseudoalteromonas sp. TaxID=53249 RepID=UPI0025EC72F8|nr:non-ribosomal peptide synthetase [Pseudoalteromonas sp.]MCH2089034.1 amino acid adenylation domain-containing protein [Pseudoalteromonas sp.]
MVNKKLQDWVVYLNDNGVFPYINAGGLKTKSAGKITNKKIIDAIVSNKSALINFLQDLNATSPLDYRERFVSAFTIDSAKEPRLHELFEAQVTLNSQSIALRFKDSCWTYDELNRRANKLARYLQRMGVTEGQRVGLCFERGMDAVAAIFATLKVGAAYVPLNPEYPNEKITNILHDANISVLVADYNFPHAASDNFKVVDLSVVNTLKEIENQPDKNFEITNGHSDSLAYVLYTSGTTGKPKGVMIKHYQVVLALANQAVFGFDASDSMAGGGAFSFDISLFEQIFPLLSGGTSVLLSKQEIMDVGALIKGTGSVSFFSAVTSLMTSWVSGIKVRLSQGESIEQLYPNLRCILVGGEAVPRQLIQDLQELFPYVRIVELYGPTENTILSTYHVKTELPQQSQSCIGIPYPHVKAYVLDNNLNKVPDGIVGELVLGGDCVSAGYFNLPEETKNSFIANCLEETSNDVLYRTGDLVRRLGDGSFEFVGRNNFQLKLRGYRIEPTEIENAILRNADVSGAIVIAQEEEQNDKLLVAYVTCKQTCNDEHSDDFESEIKQEIRNQLVTELPSFMIPSKIVVLDFFPTTVNGKIDRAALPRAEAKDAIQKEFVAPQDPLESYLCALWEQVLKIEKVGIQDNFFELGGHSLLVLKVVNKLQLLLQEDMLHFVIVFDHPTVHQLAEYLKKNFSAQLKAASIDFKAAGDKPSLEREKITTQTFEAFKSVIPSLPEYKGTDTKNSKAVFILSPPRSGSTLLRVMLAGHSNLFAPPELELLGFENLQQRKEAFQGRNEFWLEGLTRAIMELKQCDFETAHSSIAMLERDGISIRDFYGQLQELCEGQLLVDKTPSYSLDIAALKRIEDYFEDSLFIHLVRHPNAVINSFQDARMEELFFRYEHDFESRGLAEMIWTHSHQNIIEFLQGIPAQRQHRIYFEDLSANPQATMEKLCSKFDWSFETALIEPYHNVQQKMTDGVQHNSKMLGDLKFHKHNGISASTASNWQRNFEPNQLSLECSELATSFGYLEKELLSQTAKTYTHQLSYAQQSLWLVNEIEGNSPQYNIPAAFKLEGKVDYTLFNKALEVLVNRHEALRTSFKTQASETVQVVHTSVDVNLEVIDLTKFALQLREDKLEQIGKEQASAPFDLSEAPLFRLCLADIGNEQHVFFVTMHHIISDGWSSSIFFTELAYVYRKLVTGEDSALPALPAQYMDFVHWQKDMLDKETFDKHTNFWLEQLQSAPAISSIPLDRTRLKQQSHRGARLRTTLDPALSKRLRQLAQAQGVTLFMLLETAFALTVGRFSGETDVVIGTPVSGRQKAEFEDVIGFFVNSLVLRNDLSGNLGFDALLQRNKAMIRNAFQHQHVPFELLVEKLSPKRSLSHHPIYQLVFSFQNESQRDILAPEKNNSLQENNSGAEQNLLKATPLGNSTELVKFDLVFRALEQREQITIDCSYATDLFNEMTIESFMASYTRLLEQVTESPSQAVLEIDIVAQEVQRSTHLAGVESAIEKANPEAKTEFAFQHFQNYAQSQPERVAISDGNTQISYRDLDLRSNKLARFLQNKGVKPETLVAIYMPGSIQAIIAMLAVHKAGGAYLPLDTNVQAQRLEYILQDSDVALVLTEGTQSQQVSGHLPENSALICIDEPDFVSEIEAFASTSLTLDYELLPSHLAYVIYTSGSTGRPKGVMVEHGNLSRLFSASEHLFAFSSEEVWTLFHSISFDFSVWEIWGPLVNGAKLVVVPQDCKLSELEFSELFSREKVTVLNQTPSSFYALQHSLLNMTDLSHLKYVIFGGEALELDSIAKWFDSKRLDLPQLVNMYGITETTVHATFQSIDKTTWQTQKGLIGKALPDLRLYVCNEQHKLQPVGAIGELLISGPGVTRGYLGQPELTQQKYINLDIGDDKIERFYCSGDLVKVLPEGQLQYLDRKDQQVKLRGFRIELGEIEAVLRANDALSEVRVLLRNDNNEASLVAYVVTKDKTLTGDKQLSLQQALKTQLLQSLPEYMVPQFWAVVDSIPLTTNGKVDLARLPKIEILRNNREQFVAPISALETELCRVFAETLKCQNVSVEDNFFELGGHSLLAMKLINKIQSFVKAHIHVVVIFDRPTVKALAEYLTKEHSQALVEAELLDQSATKELVTDKRAQVTAENLTTFQNLIDKRSFDTDPATKNKPAIFVLSPPRSGSTLLRVMLAGHSSLISPPELELLNDLNLTVRSERFAGRNAFWKEGVIRLIMHLKKCDVENAKNIMAEFEAQRLNVIEFYRILQEWCGKQILVDKSPSYALSLDTLKRAESQFEGAHFIHLVRHPVAVIESFEKAQLEEIFFLEDHKFDSRTLAELVWVESHNNILEFTKSLPNNRHHVVQFEELTQSPEKVMSQLCAELGIEFETDMLSPYDGNKGRMIDGVHDVSMMLGDIKFHQHKGIDASISDSWKSVTTSEHISSLTKDLAEQLGYEFTSNRQAISIPELQKIEHKGHIPLSHAQKRLWLIDRIEKDSAHYNMPSAFTLTGKLDEKAFEKAFEQIIQRHEVLRSCIKEVDGEPCQITLDKFVLPLQKNDFTGLSLQECEKVVQARIKREAKKPFDLSSDLMIRASLLKTEQNIHVVIFNMHHIASDGWSMAILIREFSQLYNAFVGDKNKVLTPLPIQYSDYTLWQQSWLKETVLDEQLQYWRNQLAELPLLHSLPLENTRPAQQGFNGGLIITKVPSVIADEVIAYCRAQEVTLFMLLETMFSVLINRFSGEHDVVIGSPIAGRMHKGLESLIGFFVNSLVLRTKVQENVSFEQLLRENKTTILDAFANQSIPFETLVEEINPERSLSHHPLFQITFAVQNNEQEALSLAELELQPIAIGGNQVKFDLALNVSEQSDGLKLNWSFDRDLFTDCFINNMASSFQLMLEALVLEPSLLVSDLPLLSEQNKVQLLRQMSGETQVIDEVTCVHQLFERKAKLHPNAIALVSQEQSYSYQQINESANRLAHYLLKQDVSLETIVGIHLERSVEFVVAVLASLKAGCAYLALEPDYPKARLAFMLEDSAAEILITSSLLTEISCQSVSQVIDLTDAVKLREIAQLSIDNPMMESVGLTSQHLAYVMYTSGSTGEPKGVLVEHLSIVNQLDWMNRQYNLSREDKVLLKTPCSFDPIVWEIFWTLGYGATLVIAQPDGHKDPSYLRNIIEQEKVSIVHFVPSMLAMYVESEGARLPSSLRQVISGGEVLPANLVNKIKTQSPWLLLDNSYGPTEATIGVSWHSCEAMTNKQSVPIGLPIQNTQLLVLDDNLQICPVGVVGELHIGGRGLARGYLNRTALTEQKFINNPFAESDNCKLYKTGDLVRMNAGGKLTFIGRNDTQIKLRGQRVEPGEIESSIRSLNEVVNSAHVSIEEQSDGSGCLIAYVSLQPQAIKTMEVQLIEQRLGEWQEVFETAHLGNDTDDLELDLTSWNSSITGQAIAQQEMVEWIDGTMEHIASLEPKQLLEIGCGTGLLLFRYAEFTEEVHALDLSASVLEQVNTHVNAKGLKHVHLHHGDALEVGKFESETFDTIVLNSVAQYFPSASYFNKVLDKMLNSLQQGGSIFIGDIRNLDLSRHFAIEVEHHKSDARLFSIEEFERKIALRLHNEEELLISPAFFVNLKNDYPEISKIDVHVKVGQGNNEMLGYRYDVVIHKGAKSDKIAEPVIESFEGLEQLGTLLANCNSDAILLKNVPNGRLVKQSHLESLLRLQTDKVLLDTRNLHANDYSQLLSIKQTAKQYGFRVYPTWSCKLECLNIFFTRGNANPEVIERDYANLGGYFNTPEIRTIGEQYTAELKQHMSARIPSHMVPNKYVYIKEFPLTKNGKIDFRFLKEVYNNRQVNTQYQAPENALQEELCAIFAELLNRPQIGITEDFFDLGGHSLLATRVISFIRSKLNIEVPLRVLFDNPTVSKLYDAIGAQGVQNILPDIELVDRTNPLLLSFAQQRLWFIDKVQGSTAHYNMANAVTLVGKFNQDAFESAFKTIVRRHEVLRTTFYESSGKSYQQVNSEEQFQITFFDLTSYASSEQQKLVSKYAKEDSLQPFDLESDFMLRVSLLKLSEQKHLVLLCMHHIASDAWSRNIIIKEFSELYSGFVEGNFDTLAPLSFQYADYANWQRNWLKGEMLQNSLDYWNEHLSDLPITHSLPLAKTRPAKQSFNGQRVHRQLDTSLVSIIQQYCRTRDVTLFMFLQTSFSVLLARFSNETDIVMGTPIAGRTHKDVESLIGFFVNTLVLRSNFNSDASFNEVLEGNKNIILDAFTHQHIPFEMLVEELNPKRNRSYHPLFQVMFSLQNIEADDVLLPDLQMQPYQAGKEHTRFDLTLNISDTSDTMAVTWAFNTALFSLEQINVMADAFELLLEQVINNDQLSISSVPLVSEKQQTSRLQQCAVLEPFSYQTGLHGLVTSLALKRQSLTALQFEQQQISYKELEDKANQLANYLVSQGVGRNEFVAIHLKRSPDLIISILAVLKTGAAFVPVDEHYPDSRLNFVLEDCGANFVLTHEALVTKKQTLPVGTIVIDELECAANVASHSTSAPSSHKVEFGQPAYMIYTSGTTGLPKGVVVSHGNICNLVVAQQDMFKHNTDSEVLQFASTSFDAFISEWATTLCYGGTLHLVSSELVRDSVRLSSYIEKFGITCVTLPPGYLPYVSKRAYAVLDVLVLAGESPAKSNLAALTEFDKLRVYNAYGPTEGTICTSFAQIDCSNPSELNIGKPICNVSALVLNDSGAIQPEGVVGELYIGGIGVSQGYWQRELLTKEHFVELAWSAQGSNRWYKTGDLVSQLPDGQLKYIGRKDSQIKIRGNRVEPQEIEGHLTKLDGVDIAIVAQSEQQKESLVAWIVPEQEFKQSETCIPQWKGELLQILPEFMVPSQFELLQEIPFTNNGKVDMAKLQGLLTQQRHSHDYVAPNSPLQNRLCEIWEEVLDTEKVGINDNFFDLGGHSLLVMSLTNKVQALVGELIHVVAVFDAPTVAMFEQYLISHYGSQLLAIGLIKQNDMSNTELTSVKIDERVLADFRRLIQPFKESGNVEGKNKSAAFILSPPRSGSTLLRVMLTGHSKLFAPPELELLPFNTLEDRREAFSGRNQFWLEGTIRTIMELGGCDLEQAQQMMAHLENDKVSSQALYGLFQGWLGEGLLIDKTPSYALDLETLRRAESLFEAPKFIHLKRHPGGMISSFSEAKLQEVFFRYKHSYDDKTLAELIWIVCHQNIENFFQEIPEERKLGVYFEDLLNDPQPVLQQICEFLECEFEPQLLQPYDSSSQRMTDGLKSGTRMLGDIKFHQHSTVDNKVADAWEDKLTGYEFSSACISHARELGYDTSSMSHDSSNQKNKFLTRLTSSDVALPAIYCIPSFSGSALEFLPLANKVEGKYSIYAFDYESFERSLSVVNNVPEIAKRLLNAIKSIQPEGSIHLCGYSTGGSLAFEIARQLENEDRQNVKLTIIDSLPPSEYKTEKTESTNSALYTHLFRQISGSDISSYTLDSVEEFAMGKVEEKLAYIRSKLERDHNVTVEQTLLQKKLSLYQRQIEAVRNYCPQDKVSASFTLLSCQRHKDAKQKQMAQWQSFVEGELRVINSESSHSEIIRVEGLNDVLNAIN